MKKQLYPTYSSNFLPLTFRQSRKYTNILDCNTDVYMYFLRLLSRKHDDTPSKVKETWTKDDVKTRRQLAPRNSNEWFVA